jgi:hypothetical protein
MAYLNFKGFQKEKLPGFEQFNEGTKGVGLGATAIAV